LAAAVLLAVGVAAFGYGLRGRSSPPPATGVRRSVAVLPFIPLGRETQDDDYIALGIAEALISELSAFPTIAVPPLSATSRYGGERDPIVAGRDLGTELVLDGAIQRSADRLRINVSLVRVADGVLVWTDRFDTPWTDVFRVEDSIAEQVGRALAAVLSGEGRARVLRRRTENVAAYEAYLKGRYFWNMRTIDALQRALVYFQQAIDQDRQYAPAYAGLSDTYQMLGSMPYAVMPAAEAAEKAKAAAHKALAIDETLAEAHVSLAFVTYAFDWQWADGEREFQRAIELDPTYVTAHIWYALYLGSVGRVNEAIVEAERARALDPLSLIGTYSVGLAHYFGRRYDTAEEFARKALEIDSNFPSARRLLGEVYAAEGRHAEALTEFKRLNDTSRGNWLHMALLAQAYGRTNDRAKAREILAGMIETSKTRFVPPAQIAIGFVGLDDRDAAFAWLERARAEHSQVLTFVKMDPMFDPLRSDPRYTELIRNIGLTP
jgi:TolB-like protein/Tfp pilus assembly protein PilF